jgi:hypothetical protein
MEALTIFVLTCGVIWIIHQYSDMISSTIEFASDTFFSWSVRRIAIGRILDIIKNCLHSIQMCLVIIELVGFVGFVQAINTGNYAFPIIIMWVGIGEKTGSFFTEKKHRQINLLIMTSLKIALGTHFDNRLCVFANTCKLITLLFSEHIMIKIKYIFLRQGFASVLCNAEINAEINEDSLQSHILNILNDSMCRLSKLNAGTIELRRSIDMFCDQVSNIINELNVSTNSYASEVNKMTHCLYKFKIIGMCIIFYFVDWNMLTSKFVLYSIIAKLIEFVFGSVTPITSMMDNTFYVLKVNCQKIKNACLGVKLSASFFSIAVKKTL